MSFVTGMSPRIASCKSEFPGILLRGTSCAIFKLAFDFDLRRFEDAFRSCFVQRASETNNITISKKNTV
jgi:hypothetical protein